MASQPARRGGGFGWRGRQRRPAGRHRHPLITREHGYQQHLEQRQRRRHDLGLALVGLREEGARGSEEARMLLDEVQEQRRAHGHAVRTNGPRQPQAPRSDVPQYHSRCCTRVGHGELVDLVPRQQLRVAP